MTDKKIILGIILITILILGGGMFLLTKSSSAPSQTVTLSQNAKVEALEKTFDWGVIKYSGDKATKTFIIKNTGSDPLKLYNVKTSCHCTKAYVAINGIESPKFGMDSLSSWTGEVAPGQEAKLTAVFDPAFHGPQGVGPINRFVLIETNDKANQKLTFTLTGTVVKQ